MNIASQHFAIAFRKQTHDMMIGLSCQFGRRVAHQFFVALRSFFGGNTLRIFLKALEIIAVIRPAFL